MNKHFHYLNNDEEDFPLLGCILTIGGIMASIVAALWMFA